jgi:hypothetical protein
VLYGKDGPAPNASKKKGCLAALLEEGSSDEDDVDDVPVTLSPDLLKPWMEEFTRYLDRVDEVPSGMSVIRWWGVCH